MKLYCKGFQVSRQIIDDAIIEWSFHEAGKKNKHRIYKEYGSPEKLREIILYEIKNRCLIFPPINYKIKIEGTSGKVRIVGVENVKQQIVEYIIIRACREMYNKKLGYHQYAGITGRGSLRCSKAVRACFRKWPDGYYIKGDIKKCYDSISHNYITQIIEYFIVSKDLNYINKTILSTMGENNKGLNLGGAYSMMVTNLLLSNAYHYVESLGYYKNNKWIPLIKKQIWYLDDYVLFGTNKFDLIKAAALLQTYLKQNFNLIVKPWKISKCSESLDMCGFIHNTDHTTIRKAIFVRARKSLNHFNTNPSPRRAIRPCSYFGYFKYSNSFNISKSMNINHSINTAKSIISREMKRKIRRKYGN